MIAESNQGESAKCESMVVKSALSRLSAANPHVFKIS